MTCLPDVGNTMLMTCPPDVQHDFSAQHQGFETRITVPAAAVTAVPKCLMTHLHVATTLLGSRQTGLRHACRDLCSRRLLCCTLLCSTSCCELRCICDVPYCLPEDLCCPLALANESN